MDLDDVARALLISAIAVSWLLGILILIAIAILAN